MAASANKCLTLCLLAAAAALSAASTPPVKPSLTFTTQTVQRVPTNDKQAVGATAVGIKTISCDGKIVGVLKQSGIYTSNTGESEINLQITIILNTACGGNPPGKIFLIGDGTGLYAPSTLDKAVVGGTGPYVGKKGFMKTESGKVNLYFL